MAAVVLAMDGYNRERWPPYHKDKTTLTFQPYFHAAVASRFMPDSYAGDAKQASFGFGGCAVGGASARASLRLRARRRLCTI